MKEINNMSDTPSADGGHPFLAQAQAPLILKGTSYMDAGVITGNWDFSQKPEGHARETADARIAAVGEKEVVGIFAALGFEVFPYTRGYKVRETVKDLAAKNYTLILITESCTAGLEDLLNTYLTQPYPIILPIPDGAAAKGIGHAQINANLKKVNMKGANYNEVKQKMKES